MKKNKDRIYGGWMIRDCGQWVRATVKTTAPDMARYMANFKARRAAR